MAKISHWPAAIITQNIRWFKNLLTFQKLLENAIYSFPEAGSDGKHHSNSDMWEMLLVTLNNEAHGCTKHTKWTNVHAEDGNLNTSHLNAIFQDLINCTYKRYSRFLSWWWSHLCYVKKDEKCRSSMWDARKPSWQHSSLCEVEAFVVNTRKAVERGNGVWNHYRKCMLKQGLSQLWLP